VEKPVAVAVPGEFTEHCASQVSDGTIGQELQRLSDLAQCEFDKQDALSGWSTRLVSPMPGAH
jgi:hypothetical protein